MKKLLAGILSLGLVFGIGSSVWASNYNGDFQEMLPFMQQMHPDSSEDDLKAMYNTCHGND
ncbi:CUE domain-containing protein [Salipaludibacillus daqingensis]|uniref:CUE domain-containing protein n=1 Tax=Salipaludibacillus daqingensis TaxID=3041001 RepID=UPI002472EF1C|nr:CUE domain-containing protein [Salipaludibacillus daqingensis]